MAFLKKINFGNGSHDIAKTIVQGKPEGVISVSNTSGYNNTDSEEKDYSYDIDVNIDGTTIVKDSETTKSLKVGTVPAAQVSVADEGGKFEATNVEAALSELDGKITSTGNTAKKYKVVAVDSPAGTSQAEYKLQVAEGTSETYGDVKGSTTIVVPKDNAFVTAQLGHTGATVNQKTGAITDGDGEDALLIEYVNGSGVYTLVAVPIGAFLKEAEFKDGLQVTNGEVSAKLGQGLEFGGKSGENQSIKVKIDSTSDDAEKFLSVGANGVKISGVQNAITTAIGNLDFTDTPADSKYVTKVDETNGVVSVARADVSAAKLNNYAKGSTKGSIAATDTINQAFSKIEVTIEDNEHVTSAALNDIKAKINGMDTDLTAEVNRAKAAESEIAGKVGLTGTEGSLVFTPTTNYGGSATTVKGNLDALDTQLKTVSDKADAIQYKVSGTTLEFFGMSAHA